MKEGWERSKQKQASEGAENGLAEAEIDNADNNNQSGYKIQAGKRLELAKRQQELTQQMLDITERIANLPPEQRKMFHKFVAAQEELRTLEDALGIPLKESKPELH